MYEIGILGGMGPRATAMLFQQIIDSTPAHADQEHLNIAIANKTRIPDRSAYLLGKTEESPLPVLQEGIRELDQLGAQIILMPCNTAHYFYSQLITNSCGYIVNMVANALHYIANSQLPKQVCVLGTLGTVRTGIYEMHNSYGLSICYPEEEECATLHRIIYDVKEQNVSLLQLANEFDSVIRKIRQRKGPVSFAVACTELSCLYPLMAEREHVVDVMKLSALAAVSLCGLLPVDAGNYDIGIVRAVAQEDAHGK